MLAVWLSLPILNDVIPKDVLHFDANLNLGSITDQLGHGPSSLDIVLKYFDKLLVCFHGIDVTYQRLSANKKLR